MELLEHIRQSKLMIRAILVAVGCLPILLSGYIVISFLAFWALIGFLVGSREFAVFLIWWLLATVGLAILLLSSITFDPASRRLPLWKLIGLVGGLIAAILGCLWFGFNGRWLMCLNTFLACGAASYILFAAYGGKRKTPNKAAHPTANNVLL